PSGQPAAIRHYFGRTAAAKNRRFGKSLYSRVFLAHEQPAQGRWHRHFLATNQSTHSERRKSDPARFSQRLSEFFGLGQLRPGMDHDGHQRDRSQAATRRDSAIM